MSGVVALGGVIGRDLDHCPVVVPGALGGRAGAHPLPHSGFDRLAAVFTVRRRPEARSPYSWSGRPGRSRCRVPVAPAQVKASVHLVAGDVCGALPRSLACCSRWPASCGFVAYMTSSRTPASSRRSSSAAQSARSRYLPIRRARRDAQVRVTATCTSRSRRRCRCTGCRPGAVRRRLLVSGLVDDQHHVIFVLTCSQLRGRPVRGGIQQLPLIAAALDSRCCIRYALACPAASAGRRFTARKGLDEAVTACSRYRGIAPRSLTSVS